MSRIGYKFNTQHNEAIKLFDRNIKSIKPNAMYCDEEAHEEDRPELRKAINSLHDGDEFYIPSFANILRSFNNLPFLLSFLILHNIRIVSYGDRIDTSGILFCNNIKDILSSLSCMPAEIGHFRKRNGATRGKMSPDITLTPLIESSRKSVIIRMYERGCKVKDIQEQMGYKSRASVYNALRQYGVPSRVARKDDNEG